MFPNALEIAFDKTTGLLRTIAGKPDVIRPAMKLLILLLVNILSTFESKRASLVKSILSGYVPCCGRGEVLHYSLPESASKNYPQHPVTLLLIAMGLRLRGGGVKRIKKLTPEQQEYVDGIKFPPELEKNLRRHWKKKPEILEVPQDGKIMKVRTSWVLQRMKEKALERKKQMESLPMRLLDLGTMGVRWIRDIPGRILGPLFTKKKTTVRCVTVYLGPIFAYIHNLDSYPTASALWTQMRMQSWRPLRAFSRGLTGMQSQKPPGPSRRRIARPVRPRWVRLAAPRSCRATATSLLSKP